jgi:hypothetical protein
MLDDAWCIALAGTDHDRFLCAPNNAAAIQAAMRDLAVAINKSTETEGLRRRRICSAQPICELLNDKPPSRTPKRQPPAVYVCVNESTGAPMPPSLTGHWRCMSMALCHVLVQ